MNERNKTVAEQLKEKRIENLRNMHELMCKMNNEEAYMWWIEVGVPDEPSYYDLVDIAEDDEMYEECIETFLKILKEYGKDGFVK